MILEVHSIITRPRAEMQAAPVPTHPAGTVSHPTPGRSVTLPGCGQRRNVAACRRKLLDLVITGWRESLFQRHSAPWREYAVMTRSGCHQPSPPIAACRHRRRMSQADDAPPRFAALAATGVLAIHRVQRTVSITNFRLLWCQRAELISIAWSSEWTPQQLELLPAINQREDIAEAFAGINTYIVIYRK